MKRAYANWPNGLMYHYNLYFKRIISCFKKYPQSDFVKKITGVGSVSLAAADLASNGQVVTKRYAGQGVTFALGRNEDDTCCTWWD